MARQFNPQRDIQAWQLFDRVCAVFTQEEAPDGVSDLISMLYIDWSPKLVLVHNCDMTKRQANAICKKVNERGIISLEAWTKCKPNTEEQNNPFFPAFRSYNYDFEQDVNEVTM